MKKRKFQKIKQEKKKKRKQSRKKEREPQQQKKKTKRKNYSPYLVSSAFSYFFSLWA